MKIFLRNQWKETEEFDVLLFWLRFDNRLSRPIISIALFIVGLGIHIMI